MEGSIDLTLTLGLPGSSATRVPSRQFINTPAAPVSQGFGSGDSAGRAPADHDENSAAMNLMEFLRSEERKGYYCVIDLSANQGKVGGSKKRRTSHSDERPVVPRHVDRNRRCRNFNCRTSETPLWRSGPFGPKSLCNACGIKYRKIKLKEKPAGEGASGEGSSNAS